MKKLRRVYRDFRAAGPGKERTRRRQRLEKEKLDFLNQENAFRAPKKVLAAVLRQTPTETSPTRVRRVLSAERKARKGPRRLKACRRAKESHWDAAQQRRRRVCLGERDLQR